MKNSGSIYTIPLEDYSYESRKLMNRIIEDFKGEGIQVLKGKRQLCNKK